MRKVLSFFIGIVLVLVTLGVLMMGSASLTKYEGDAAYFWKRQMVWLAVAFVVAVLAARFDYRRYRRLAIPLALLSIALLILVRIPGIGHRINGSWRWLRVGPISIQPSEPAKVAIVVLLSWWLARVRRRIDEPRYGILVPIGILACFVGPIVVEPDFGTTMLISAVVACMIFLSGANVLPLLAAGLTGLMGLAVLIFRNPERMSRIFAFLDPQKYEQGKAWQLINSLRAFASGGLFGVGFGNSMQKYHYLPEAHTDFIFPIVGEELGLVAGLAIMLLFLCLFLLGMKIAKEAPDDFGRFLVYGIILMITLQAVINFAVVTGCVPTKGLALPFISYGGSSLLVSGVMIGILVNVARSAMHAEKDPARGLFKDRTSDV